MARARHNGGGGARRKRWLTCLAFTALLLTPAASRAGTKTCLTGTDPGVAADAGQIAAVRALIDAACVCASFDGSTRKTHAKYASCAAGVIRSEVSTGQLRTPCKRTVKKYYSTSTCGVPASKDVVPCITTTAAGRVSCSIKPMALCVGPRKVACPGFTTCIDAADTDGDGSVGADDSGTCATGTSATPTATPTSTQTLPPGVPTNTVTPLPHFVDNGNGTITDNQTGLMWEKKDQAGGLHQYDTSYTWAGRCSDNSLCQPDAVAASACSAATGGALGCSECSVGSCNVDPLGLGAPTTIWGWLMQLNGAHFAGHSDWRLPTVSRDGGTPELETIRAAPYPCGTNPCVPAVFNTGCMPGCAVTGCSCTAANYNWSASTEAANTGVGWAVDFYSGDVAFGVKDNGFSVRAVR